MLKRLVKRAKIIPIAHLKILDNKFVIFENLTLSVKLSATHKMIITINIGSNIFIKNSIIAPDKSAITG